MQSALEGDLDPQQSIANVYCGPLDDFVARRDALAKELRAAGQREAASGVKTLRKPSRIAWALDVAALENTDAVDALAAAVGGTLDAQASGGDVRGAMVRLRTALRELATHAASVAEHAGYPLDAGALGNALLAVIAQPGSFEQLRASHLADVPEAGGLDFLTALPSTPSPAVTPAQPRAERSAAAPAQDAAAQKAERAAEEAVAARARAHERAEAERRSLAEAESALQTAEAQLRKAEDEAGAARRERDRVRAASDAAERALAEAQHRLDALQRRRPAR